MYKGKEADARTVGRDLGVRAVFKGRVMQRGDNLDISAELVDARDNSHIWGQHYSRTPADILALQEEIAKEMTTMLRMRLSADESAWRRATLRIRPIRLPERPLLVEQNKMRRDITSARILSAGDRQRSHLLGFIPRLGRLLQFTCRRWYGSPEGGLSEEPRMPR
jgi:hypothetical protein